MRLSVLRLTSMTLDAQTLDAQTLDAQTLDAQTLDAKGQHMALADWTIKKSDPLAEAAIITVSPIAGVGSLRTRANAGRYQIHLVRQAIGGYTPGIRAGKIRTLTRHEDNGIKASAILAMMSSPDVTTTGNGYIGILDFTAQLARIFRLNGGGLADNAQWVEIGTAASITFGVGDVRAFELEWKPAGGTNSLILRYGIQQDFSDLTAVVSGSDSVLTTSQGEGIAHISFEIPNDKRIVYDKTSLTEILI